MTPSCPSSCERATRFQAASLCSASGIEARLAAACRRPASVGSRASSASISASPALPVTASRRSSAQRSSVSTDRPGTATDPSSRPAMKSSCSGVTAVQPSSCIQASW